MKHPDWLTVEAPPDGPRTPLVVSVPHSGVWIPADDDSPYALDPTSLMKDGDLHVDRLFAGAFERGATVIRTSVSRFVVDLNRQADDIAPQAVEGGVVRDEAGYYGVRGVIWAVNSQGEPIYRRPLRASEYEARIARYWRPYHAALAEALEAARSRFGYALLLDAHSMPSRGARMHSDPDRTRADVVPGDLHGRSCGRWMSRATTKYWRSKALRVTPNEPYAGGGTTRTYGRPEQGVHAIQLELNRALYMNEATLAPNLGFELLAARCDGYVEALLGAAIHERSLLAGPRVAR